MICGEKGMVSDLFGRQIFLTSCRMHAGNCAWIATINLMKGEDMERKGKRERATFALLVIAAITLIACEKPKQEPLFPETVTRLLPHGTPHWLDNDRLLLVARAPDDKLYDGEGHWKPGLYILDVRSNTYSRYAEVGDPPLFCYNQGFVTYMNRGSNLSFGTDGKPQGSSDMLFMEGWFGKEKALPQGVRPSIEPGYDVYFANCPVFDRKKLLTPEHWVLDEGHFPVMAYFLRPEHGYIYASHCRERYCNGSPGIAQEDFEKPVKLFIPGVAEPVELPILGKEFSLGVRVRYMEWLGKYLIIPATRRDTPYRYGNGLTGKAPYQVYLMTPEAQVEAFPIPEGKWLPGSGWLATRAGFYFSNVGATQQVDGGWFLAWDGQIQRLHSGAGNMAVSPDGCKLFLATSRNANPDEDGLGRIVDFCAKKN